MLNNLLCSQINFFLRFKIIFYLSHTQLHREYITSSEMYSLHLTHPKWTHTRSSGQPCYSTRGAVGGSVLCSRTPQSWYWRRILPPPTIPAGPEIQTHNLPLTSPTRYPLGHDCPFRLVKVYHHRPLMSWSENVWFLSNWLMLTSQHCSHAHQSRDNQSENSFLWSEGKTP